MSSIVIAGDTSGSVTLQAPAVAGSTILTLPATSGTVQTSGAGYTTNGVAFASSTSALATSSAFQFNGTDLGLGVTPSVNTVSGSGYRQIEVGTSIGNMIFAGGSEMYVWQNVIYNSGVKYAQSTQASQYRQNAGKHEFYTAPTGTAGNAITFTQAMTLTEAGNLGIGTSSPATKLEVTASAPEVRISSSNAGQTSGSSVGILSFYTPDATTPGGAGVAASIETLSTTSNGSDYALVISKREGSGGGSNFINLGTSSSGAISFGTNTSGSATERARITSGGDLYVGTTTGTIGTGNFGVVNAQDGGLFASRNYGSGVVVFQVGGNAGVLRVLGNGNAENTNNSYGAVSDVKLKENIVDASPKLADLMQVKVRNYNLIGDTTKQIGVVAQELETVFPSMIDVTLDKDAEDNDLGTTTKSVKYSVFVPMLIKAIQELKAEFDAYKASHP